MDNEDCLWSSSPGGGQRIRSGLPCWTTVVFAARLLAAHVHCSLFLPRIRSGSENNESIPDAAQKNTFPRVMTPLSHLSPIDFRLAGASQGEHGELVKEGSSARFRVRESGDVGMGSKTDSYHLAGKRGFSPSCQIPERGPIYFSLASRKIRALNYIFCDLK